MSENLITQADIEAYAPELDLSQYSGATISGMITRASQRAIDFCNVDGFFRTTVINERERALIGANGDLIHSFRRRPVAQGDVSAIRLVGVEVNQSLTIRNNNSDIYFIETPSNWVIYPSNFLIAHGRGLISLRNADLFVEIDYTGGYLPEELPASIKEAVTLYVRSILAKKFNPAGAASFKQGSIAMNFKGSGTDGGISKDINVLEAEDLLSQYVRRVI